MDFCNFRNRWLASVRCSRISSAVGTGVQYSSTCSEIPFFDLGSDQETSLILHPFATMDTTMHNYLKLSPKEAKAQYHALIDEVRAINGTFCCIFHNQNLCDDYGWQGWKEVYEDLLDYACNDNNLTTTAAL